MTSPQVLTLVTARGGSKGVPRKNLAPVAGKPLIAHTILAARAASGLDRVIVSTDDAEIADVARRYGAEVPFLRPAELARDDTPGIAPVLHALQWLEQEEDCRPAYVLLLQPTSPLRTAQDIEDAVRLARERDADSVIGVCEAKAHPYVAMKLGVDGALQSYLDLDFDDLQKKYPRRQDLPAAYLVNGALYLTRRDVLLNEKSFYGKRTYGYVMPAERSLDVDTAWDLELANLILTANSRSA